MDEPPSDVHDGSVVQTITQEQLAALTATSNLTPGEVESAEGHQERQPEIYYTYVNSEEEAASLIQSQQVRR